MARFALSLRVSSPKLSALRNVGMVGYGIERKSAGRGSGRFAGGLWLAGLVTFILLASAGGQALGGAAPAADHDGTQPVERFRDCSECPEMVALPAGRFLMGASPNELDGLRQGYGWPRLGEPQHWVEINEPFAVGVFEVTFAEWDACVHAGGCDVVSSDKGWGRDRRPVILVSWHDTLDYVWWLSERSGKRYRLLSEAEWEYAARAGTVTGYHFGSALKAEHANFGGAGTLPVGSFPPNRFGLHDMHGNVWEWVQDCPNDSYSGAPSDGRAWEAGFCPWRIIRGGAWNAPPIQLRSSARDAEPTARRKSNVGFRIARSLP